MKHSKHFVLSLLFPVVYHFILVQHHCKIETWKAITGEHTRLLYHLSKERSSIMGMVLGVLVYGLVIGLVFLNTNK